MLEYQYQNKDSLFKVEVVTLVSRLKNLDMAFSQTFILIFDWRIFASDVVFGAGIASVANWDIDLWFPLFLVVEGRDIEVDYIMDFR